LCREAFGQPPHDNRREKALILSHLRCLRIAFFFWKNRLIKDKKKVFFSVSHYCLITVPALITWEKNCHFLLIVLKAGEQGRIIIDQ